MSIVNLKQKIAAALDTLKSDVDREVLKAHDLFVTEVHERLTAIEESLASYGIGAEQSPPVVPVEGHPALAPVEEHHEE
jgi:hypothetical protein